MTRSTRRHRGPWLAALGALLLATAAGRTQPPLKAPRPGPAAPAKSVALVVAHGKYPAGGDLTASAFAAAELAAAFDRSNYQVVVLTDPGMLADVKKKLEERPGVTVAAAKDAAAVTAECEKWIKAVAQEKPPLAVLVLSGHGEERPATDPNPGPTLLTVADEPGQGGVSVWALREQARRAGRLLIVHNACRTPAPAAPALNAVDEQGKPVAPVENAAAVEIPGVSPAAARWVLAKKALAVAIEPPAKAGQGPTILYATQSGKGADARAGLLAHLAAGLTDDGERMTKFLQSKGGGSSLQEGLILQDWLLFGLTGLLDATELKQAHQLVVGAVPLHQRVAVREKGKWVAPRRRDVVEELLPLLATGLTAAGGNFEVAYTAEGGLRTTRPANKVVASGQEYGGLQLPADFDPRDRYLEVDVVADPVVNGPGKGKPFRFVVSATHITPDSAAGYWLADNKQMWSPPAGVPYRIQFPLSAVPFANADGVRLLNGFALGAPAGQTALWPDGGTVSVVGMRVVPQVRGQEVVKANGFALVPDLLSGVWLAGDRPGDQAGAPLAMTRAADAGKKKEWVATNPTPGILTRVGGPLVTPVLLPPNGELVVEVTNLDPQKPASLLVDLLGLGAKPDDKPRVYLSEAEVALAAGGSRKVRLPITGTGYANYLGLATKAKSLRIKVLAVMPK